MKAIPFILFAAVAATGCGKPSSQSQHIQAWIESWAETGMYLPGDDQVEFIRANLADVQTELAEALAHENPAVRQRAAYVVAEIGPDANALGDNVFAQLKRDSEQLVQICLIDALGAVRYQSEEALAYLRSKYDSLSEENKVATRAGAYADVDEKINLAGVLYVLETAENRGPYRDFVIQWLRAPGEELSASQLDGYWERRWMAVISLESMETASEAIPSLEAMLDEVASKSWVPVHVPRVLAVLKADASESEREEE